MTWLLIKLAIRFLAFGAIFGFAAWKMKRISIRPKYALPLVAVVFAILNVGLYWLAKPILNLATLGTLWIATPLIVNGLLLHATNRILRPLKIEGFGALLRLSLLLTAAHGALYLALDVIPTW